jgi:uridine monophosphate synthetase
LIPIETDIMTADAAIPRSLKHEIMTGIYDNGMLLTSKRDKPEGWTLVSGLWSPFYIQLRLISSFPRVLRKAAEAMALLIEEKAPQVNRLVGIAFAGIPIATALSLQSGLPACHTRKLTGVRGETDVENALSKYGQHSLLEGQLRDGDRICLVDDLVTGMDSKLVARSQVLKEVEGRGLEDVRCDDIVVLIDRQQGARKRARQAGLQLHSVIDFVDEGLPLLEDIMDPDEYTLLMRYLEHPERFQKS